MPTARLVHATTSSRRYIVPLLIVVRFFLFQIRFSPRPCRLLKLSWMPPRYYMKFAESDAIERFVGI